MKFNRKLALVLALVLSVAAATTGTLAYLTDRDSAANVFTMGNVSIKLDEGKFDNTKDNILLPGTAIAKEPSIKNTGSVDAYVWMEVAVPTGALRVLILDYGEWGEDGKDSGWTLLNNSTTAEINGKQCDVYTYLYKNILEPGESSNTLFTSVGMALTVDITPEGDAYIVDKGETTSLGFNVKDGELPVYVSAYAIQTVNGNGTTFETVNAAYAAYHAQWGDKGTEWGSTTITVEPDTSWYDNNKGATEYSISTAAELFGLAKIVNSGEYADDFKNNLSTFYFKGKTIKLTADIDLHDQPWTPIGQTGGSQFVGTFDGNGKTIKNLSITEDATIVNGNKYYAVGLFGWAGDKHDYSSVTIKNLTIDGVTITGHHYVGAVAGYIELGSIENCTVKNAKISAPHKDGDRCGDKVGAIVGFCAPNYDASTASPTNITIKNCKAVDCTIGAARDAGQLIGTRYTACSTIEECTAENVTVSAIAGCTDEDAGTNITNDIVGHSI